jgi:Kef-type K+ transport system membrane component KefB
MAFVEIGFIITLFVAALGIHVSNKIKLPSSIGLIIIGLAFGPAFLDLVHSSDITNFLAHIGLTLLIFRIGLESDIGSLKSKESISIGIASTIVPWALGFIVTWLLGYNTIESFFIGVIIASTSTVISISILTELNVLEKNFAKTIIGAAIIDDILSLFALSIATSLAITTTFNFIKIAENIGLTLFIITISIVFGIKFLSVMKKFSHLKIDKSAFDLFLIALVLLAAVFAEDIGLSGIVGAFFGGVVITESKFHKEERELEEIVNPLVAIFAPLFFLNLGLLVNFQDIRDGLLLGLVLTFVAIAGEMIGGYFSAKNLGIEKLDAILIGLGMIPRGEVALIAAQIGLTIGIISSSIFSSIIIMGLLTSIITPLLFFHFLTPYTRATTIEEFEREKKRVMKSLNIISRLRLRLEEIRLKTTWEKLKFKKK